MRRNHRHYRKRQAPQLVDISLTPLIDTALTLLVIFMVATPMIQNAIRVNLPRGQAKEDNGERQEMVVYIDEHNQLFFNRVKVGQNELVDEIKKRIGQQQDKAVFVKASESISYGSVLELVDRIKVVGGVSHVVLATQKRA